MLLGTLVMVYILHVLGDNYTIKNSIQINKTLFSVLVLIYPLTDLLRVFILRLRQGKSPFAADQNHIHHLLHKKGIKPIINVLIIQWLSISVLLLYVFCTAKLWKHKFIYIKSFIFWFIKEFTAGLIFFHANINNT